MPSKFQYYMICQLKNLIYYLHACLAILYAKGMGNGTQAIGKTNKLYQSWLCVEMPFMMVPWHTHVTNS